MMSLGRENVRGRWAAVWILSALVVSVPLGFLLVDLFLGLSFSPTAAMQSSLVWPIFGAVVAIVVLLLREDSRPSVRGALKLAIGCAVVAGTVAFSWLMIYSLVAGMLEG
jgi:hypothetical protein